MAAIIDVDTHWTFDWEFQLAKGPLAPFAGEFPEALELLAYFFAGDLIEALPADQRPKPHQLFRLPPEQKIPEHWERIVRTEKVDDRLAWMDRIGIDFCLVNPGGYGSTYPLIADRTMRWNFIRAANDVLLDVLDGHADRISPITIIDIADQEAAIAEMTRMREAGSRAFSIRTAPVGGMSLGHPHFDPIWSAAVDLGMLINVHVGNVPGTFGDWGNVGWDFDDPNSIGPFLRMANTQRHHSAEQFLNAMLYGGAFARHPGLSIVLSEIWAGWLPNFVKQTEVFCAKRGPWGEWPFPLSATDYLNRHVKLTPLPGLGDWNTIDLLEAHPEIVVFSSDYPHTEGNCDPINLYRSDMDRLDGDLQASFMGGAMNGCFARMGQPIDAATTTH